MGIAKPLVVLGCTALFSLSVQANEKWICEPAKIERLGVFVMAPVSYTSAFAGEVNQVALVNQDVAKFSDARGYDTGSKSVSCEETLDADLNAENPVKLLACTTSKYVPTNCPRPSDQVSLTFLSDSDLVFVKDSCESRLKKYVTTQEFDGVYTLVSEQKVYQSKHQVFRGTAIDDSPDLKFSSYEKTLALTGFTSLKKAAFASVPSYYHNYRLKLQCIEG